MTIELPTVSGKVTLELILTCARDYGIVQLHVNETAVGAPIDLYNPDVITSGLLTFPGVDLSEGRPTLTIQVVGANPDSQKSYLSGIDCLRIRRADGTYATGE